jgi:hypothetical protein
MTGKTLKVSLKPYCPCTGLLVQLLLRLSAFMQVEHLQQIKHLLPDAFSWQHVMISSSATSSRQEQQLVISLPERHVRGTSGSKVQLELLEEKLRANASGKVSSSTPTTSCP